MEIVKSVLKPVMSKHLKELMDDAMVYGWPHLQITMWFGFNNLKTAKQSGVTLMPSWNSAGPGFACCPHPATSKPSVSAAPTKKLASERMPTAIMANPSTRACAAFNKAGFTQQDDT